MGVRGVPDVVRFERREPQEGRRFLGRARSRGGVRAAEGASVRASAVTDHRPVVVGRGWNSFTDLLP